MSKRERYAWLLAAVLLLAGGLRLEWRIFDLEEQVRCTRVYLGLPSSTGK